MFKWLLQKHNMIMDIKFTVFLNVTSYGLAVRYKGIGETFFYACKVDDISAWKAETAYLSEYFISSSA